MVQRRDQELTLSTETMAPVDRTKNAPHARTDNRCKDRVEAMILHEKCTDAQDRKASRPTEISSLPEMMTRPRPEAMIANGGHRVENVEDVLGRQKCSVRMGKQQNVAARTTKTHASRVFPRTCLILMTFPDIQLIAEIDCISSAGRADPGSSRSTVRAG